MRPLDLDLVHPFPDPPAPGRAIAVAPGLLWARLPLPFRLDHVNVYCLEDGDGWAVIDTGLDDRPTRAAWERLLAGPLGGRPVTRLVVTHCHPDHVGLAQWFVERFGVRLEMPETEYLTALVIHLDPGAIDGDPYEQFYEDHGLDADTTADVMKRGHRYLRMVAGLPKTFRRVVAGESLLVGGRSLRVLTGGGHAPEQMMLHDAEAGLFLSADQVLPRISPNVGVWPRDPEGDPLGIYLRSLRAIQAAIPADVLVLPGHDLPFTGLHGRIGAILAHHAGRCEAIERACRLDPKSAAELIPVVFTRPLDPHGTGFAFSEVLAHVNYMLRRGRLHAVPSHDGVRRVASGAA